jgi:hypothetical protein
MCVWCSSRCLDEKEKGISQGVRAKVGGLDLG